MKKLMFVAVAALSVAAFAHEDITAKVEGFYDVQLTTKRLAHAEKTYTKSFSSSTSKGTAVEQLKKFVNSSDYVNITNTPGYKIVDGDWEASGKEGVKKIVVKYSVFQTSKQNKDGTHDKDATYVTKVVSDSEKGVYDAKTGKVYIWEPTKVTIDGDSAIDGAKIDKNGNASGYVAYEAPLAMHKQFVATDDNKAAGGFTGGYAVATDGTVLDFKGLTAFGTGTFDSKKDYVKSVAGNVAGKYPDDVKFGCYGTWKINKDTKDYGNGEVLNTVLLKKGCVELVNERD